MNVCFEEGVSNALEVRCFQERLVIDKYIFVWFNEHVTHVTHVCNDVQEGCARRSFDLPDSICDAPGLEHVHVRQTRTSKQ